MSSGCCNQPAPQACKVGRVGLWVVPAASSNPRRGTEGTEFMANATERAKNRRIKHE
jgi:predicted thioredoxin/glutaredoxin